MNKRNFYFSLLLVASVAGYSCNKSVESSSNVSHKVAVENRFAEFKTVLDEDKKEEKDAKVATKHILKEHGVSEANVNQALTRSEEQEQKVVNALQEISSDFVDKYGSGKRVDDVSKEEIKALLDDYLARHPEFVTAKGPDGKEVEGLSERECRELCSIFSGNRRYAKCYLECRGTVGSEEIFGTRKEAPHTIIANN